MTGRRRILIALAVAYGAGLGWGYFRLPWAAVKSLRDARILAAAPAVSLIEADVSAPQLGYLRGSLRVTAAPVVPRVSVGVRWNALVIARVESGHYLGPLAAEGRDSLYILLAVPTCGSSVSRLVYSWAEA